MNPARVAAMLGAEIARIVPAMHLECSTNNETTITNLIARALREELKCSPRQCDHVQLITTNIPRLFKCVDCDKTVIL